MENNYKHWQLETDDNQLVWCRLDVQESSTNILSSEVLSEFRQIVDALQQNTPAGLVILSGKDNGFIAGANVKEFTEITDVDEARSYIKNVHTLFNDLEALACPTLSLINGFCLGGGLELALACRYRVALDVPGTRIGFPEVLLGIFPGFGGSMRSIRMLGPVKALPLMLSGRTLDARKAKKLGLIDRVVPQRQLMNAARGMLLKQPAVQKASAWLDVFKLEPVRAIFVRLSKREVRKQAKQQHYPAPYALLDAWQKHGSNDVAMLNAEADGVAELITSETSKNLVRVYLLQERLKSLGSLDDNEAKQNVKHVHVIGAGVMGGDIAAWCVAQGMTVTLQDREAKFIAPAIKRAHALFKKRFKIERLITAAKDRLIPDIEGVGVERADVLIEAIVENADIKAELFRELEPRLKETAIMATNTSSIALEAISQHLKQPSRLVGIHFFNPVAKMQLVEIVHADNTEQKWVKLAAAFCRRINRLPLPVKSSPGFLVNRVLTPYLLEAVTMLDEDVPAELIDKVAKDFGMPMGPVELADTVGLDICLSVAKNMSEKINITIPAKLEQMVQRGELGKKTDKGFYTYQKGKPQKQAIQPSDDVHVIENRMIMRIVNECVACLRDEIVDDADLLDAGMVYGTGFAPFRGGPMHYVDTVGHEQMRETLQELQDEHGDRFKADAHWESLK